MDVIPVQVCLEDGSLIVSVDARHALLQWYGAQLPAPKIDDMEYLKPYQVGPAIPTNRNRFIPLVVGAIERKWNKSPKLNPKLSYEVQCRMILEWLRQHADVDRLLWNSNRIFEVE